MTLFLLGIFLCLFSFNLAITTGPTSQGWASCFGDYVAIIGDDSVYSGLGSYISGEDFTWTTAMCGPNWANQATGSCYAVTCTGAMSGGLNCLTTNPTYVRVIDELGNTCDPASGSQNHVFDLNNVPFNTIGSDGASCSGNMYVNYAPVDCQEAGLAPGGIQIGLAPNQVDPWCPSFFFSNVGYSGALYSVEVSVNGGSTWMPFSHSTSNGARWDCTTGSGTYLGVALSFRLVSCDLDPLPAACNPGKTITINNFLPTNWCSSGGVPCPPTSFQASVNFPSDSAAPIAAPKAPVSVPKAPVPVPKAPVPVPKAPVPVPKAPVPVPKAPVPVPKAPVPVPKAPVPVPTAPVPVPKASESSSGSNSPRFVIYVDALTAWWPPTAIAAGLGIPGYATHSYNVINLAFWTSSSGPVDAAGVWANPLNYVSTGSPWGNTNDAIQKAWASAYHSQGISVLVSAFGATDFPTSAGADPVATATALAEFVKSNNLDGVDLDWEDNNAMNAGTGEAWLISCTATLRQLLPAPYIISHAPQAPYFTGTSTYVNGGYLTVDSSVGNDIDYYNVQFYNQGTSEYETYQTLFQVSDGWATNTAVAQMVAHGIPKSKIVVGKGVAAGDVTNTGFVAQATLKTILQEGVNNGYTAGFMGWELSSDTTNWGSDLASVFSGVQAPVPAPKAPVPVPKAPVPVPIAPVPVPKAPVPAPKAPVPAPKAPVPVPKAPVSGTTMCANSDGYPCDGCCSQWGYCGTTAAYCDPAQGCSSNCWSSSSGDRESGDNGQQGSGPTIPAYGIALIVVGGVLVVFLVAAAVGYKMYRSRPQMETV